MFHLYSLLFCPRSVLTSLIRRYLTGLARTEQVDPNEIEPITENSINVTTFGLGWS